MAKLDHSSYYLADMSCKRPKLSRDQTKEVENSAQSKCMKLSEKIIEEDDVIYILEDKDKNLDKNFLKTLNTITVISRHTNDDSESDIDVEVESEGGTELENHHSDKDVAVESEEAKLDKNFSKIDQTYVEEKRHYADDTYGETDNRSSLSILHSGNISKNSSLFTSDIENSTGTKLVNMYGTHVEENNQVDGSQKSTFTSALSRLSVHTPVKDRQTYRQLRQSKKETWPFCTCGVSQVKVGGDINSKQVVNHSACSLGDIQEKGLNSRNIQGEMNNCSNFSYKSKQQEVEKTVLYPVLRKQLSSRTYQPKLTIQPTVPVQLIENLHRSKNKLTHNNRMCFDDTSVCSEKLSRCVSPSEKQRSPFLHHRSTQTEYSEKCEMFQTRQNVEDPRIHPCQRTLGSGQVTRQPPSVIICCVSDSVIRDVNVKRLTSCRVVVPKIDGYSICRYKTCALCRDYYSALNSNVMSSKIL